MTNETITARLEELRAIIRAENISYGELHELQGYGEAGHIPESDVELREWAGLPEHPADKPHAIDCDMGEDCLCDFASSASRQHYIDTGRYLRQGEALES
jgi:hypothetical protein